VRRLGELVLLNDLGDIRVDKHNNEKVSEGSRDILL
jgi:hypothetical protein